MNNDAPIGNDPFKSTNEQMKFAVEDIGTTTDTELRQVRLRKVL